MRAAAIFGLGCSPKHLKVFQDASERCAIDWRFGMPAASEGIDVILLFGGDGTIHRHLAQLTELGLPVLIVPAGSGNDFARALGLRSVRDSSAAWRRFCVEQQNVLTIDLGTISPLADAVGASAPHESARNPARHYFCSVAGIGLDAEVSGRANRLPRWLLGHGGYALTLAATIFRFAPSPMKISSADEIGAPTTLSNQSTILAAFANTSIYGGGMKIAPQAKFDDGQLDVCVISAINPFKLAYLFPTVYLGRHLKIREVNYFKSPRVRVETETPLDVYADGEYVCRTPVEIGVQRAALKVLVP
jgi:diacylglycerol kinase (ATP)